ncbi:MAG: thioesterase family protein [Candidatus Pacebacteria bacterium]|nr:thioesterase family protein [Candidatus Paceibacterota bacterium]
MLSLPESCDFVVPADWIDSNGHMNVAWYVHAFDSVIDRIFCQFGLATEDIPRSLRSFFTLDLRIQYRSELLLGDRCGFDYRIVGFDSYRIHFRMVMIRRSDGVVAALLDQLSIAVDMETRAKAVIPREYLDRIAAMVAAQGDGGGDEPRLERFDRPIGIG